MSDEQKKLLPHSAEAERGVLGALIVGGVEILDICIQAGLRPEAFFVAAHRKVYGRILTMADKQIDLITVQADLDTNNLLQAVGGEVFLRDLVDQLPTVTHAEAYIEQVKKRALQRHLIEIAYDIQEEAPHTEDPKQMVSQIESRFIQMQAGFARPKTTKDIVSEIREDLECETQRDFAGVPSVFQAVNSLLYGYEGLIILAARPSQGKSTLMLNDVTFQAEQGYRPAVASLEMTKRLCYERMACADVGVTYLSVKTRRLASDTKKRYLQSLDRLMGLDMHIFDDVYDIDSLKSRARRLKIKHDIGILWVDYMQLFSELGKFRSRNEFIGHVSGALKQLSKLLEIPVVALSQLSRQLEYQAGKKAPPRRPRLSDLRDSGSIEQDADVVIFLSRHPKENEVTISEVAKHRNGAIGIKNLHQQFRYMRFMDISYEQEEEKPAASQSDLL